MKGLTVGWPLGIRFQLMLWYSAIFLCLIVLFGVLFYLRFQTMLATSLDTALQVKAQQIAGDITLEKERLVVHDAIAELPGFEVPLQRLPVFAGDVNLGVLIRVLNAQGVPFRTTPAFGLVQAPVQSVSHPLHGIPWQGTVPTVDGQAVRLYSRALVQDGHIIAVIQVATPLTQMQTALRDVLLTFLFLTPLILLIGMLVSVWLAGRAFLPIERLARTARMINEGDLRQRVPLPPAHDEVWHLAVTLNEMIERLEQAFVRQRRFVADASHELRTPLTVILSKARLALLEVFPPEEYRSVFQEIYDEAERLGKLIRDLLALVRVDEGEVRLQQESVCLNRLVAEVVAVMETVATEQHIAIEASVSEPVTVRGDEARLMQVVMNLLDNAISYTPFGGQVAVGVQAKHGQAVLTIRDTGVGIAPHHLPYLFDRFYRGDAARTQTASGKSGLGLSIVQWIIKAHQGTVRVQSEVGRGSTFTVTLPLENAFNETSAPAERF